jgi:hypothetical protein
MTELMYGINGIAFLELVTTSRRSGAAQTHDRLAVRTSKVSRSAAASVWATGGLASSLRPLVIRG